MARASGEEDKSRTMVVSSTRTRRRRTRGVGYCYTDDDDDDDDDDDIVAVSSTNLPTNIQTNHLPSIIINHTLQPPTIHQQLYHLTSSPMDHHHHHHHDPNSLLWKGFFNNNNNNNNNPGPSSSKNHFYHHPQEEEESGFGPNWNEQNRLLVVDDSSLRCVFPCQGNERPSQGLSLSLSSSANPSSIALQSFELIRHNQQQQQQQQQQDGGDMDDQFRLNIQQNQHIQLLDGLLGKTTNLHHHPQEEGGGEGEFQIRNSKYMGPARELLNEFCDLGGGQRQQPTKTKKKKKKKKPHRSTTGSGSGTHWQEEEEEEGDDDDDDDDDDSSSRKAPLCSTLQLLELQKRKSKLLSMLQEVDRRYRQYCDEMKAVVSGFEAVAGEGAGKVYSALASRAMSTHFRCLRDGIARQIKATRKAMGDDGGQDKDSSGVGTRGETPRLRLLDQSFRQQRAYQQMTMMEAHPWRPQRGLPERSVSLLRAWLFEHFLHPYPSDVDKHILARQTGLSRSQVSNWFINARVRLWKPMVEEMYLEETKDHQITIPSSSSDNNNNSIGFRSQNDPTRNHIQGPHPRPEDQKPTSDQLVRIDSECLSSIINNNNRHHPERSNHEFGAVELDFSAAGSYGGGGGVSLTLGLQNNSGGVSLEFSEAAAAAASQSSLFYSSRDHHIDHNHHHHHDQYSSLLDTTESQNLPYRNLMGAQLLHDLAG